MFVFIPCVDLSPILGPLGVLPELCAQIEQWAAEFTAREVREVMWRAYCSSGIRYSVIALPWDDRAAYKLQGGQIIVNSKTILKADPVVTADTIFGLESRWGIKCKRRTEDDWMSVNWLKYRQEGILARDDCPSEAVLKCGLVAGYYDLD